jgi:hypothetical protein
MWALAAVAKRGRLGVSSRTGTVKPTTPTTRAMGCHKRIFSKEELQ